MTDYTPATEEVRANWEACLWEGIADTASRKDAEWDGERMRAQFDRWLTGVIRQAKRDGWEEGADAGVAYALDQPPTPPTNPYADE